MVDLNNSNEIQIVCGGTTCDPSYSLQNLHTRGGRLGTCTTAGSDGYSLRLTTGDSADVELLCQGVSMGIITANSTASCMVGQMMKLICCAKIGEYCVGVVNDG